MVKLHTNHGVITLELDAEKAPQTVANFLARQKDVLILCGGTATGKS